MNELYSYHVFLFPFKWEIWQGEKHTKTPLSGRTLLKDIQKQLPAPYWEPFTFVPQIKQGYNTYNEYSYFYDFARDVLCLDEKQRNIGALQFEYKGVCPTSTYNISFAKKDYQLSIQKILLNLYDDGIGVLSFHLENRTYKDFDDILKINDSGRRLYPQFLGTDNNRLTQIPKGSFLANSIKLQDVDWIGGTKIIEDFSHYDQQEQVVEMPFVLPNHFAKLLGQRFVTIYQHHLKGDVLIHPILDDRMFVLSYALNQSLLEDLAKIAEKDNDDSTNQEAIKKAKKQWYEYVFVDGSGSTCHSETMLNRHLEAATYDRWLGYKADGKYAGHLFGISRYSMVVLVTDSWFPKNVLIHHVRYIYFQMVLLCLVQRASLINFSGEVARISERLSSDFRKLDAERSHIAKLYLSYIKFVNRIYFREISPQEQGIELYDQLQQQMRIRQDVEDLGREIQELNTFSDTIQQGHLTFIAGKFLPASLVAGILGINAEIGKPTEKFWIGVAIIAIVFFISDGIIRLLQKK
jgi:hypothetical protein